MSLNRYGVKRDANELEIVKALLKLGCTVMRADQVDLIVGYKGINYLMEVKNPKNKPKKATSLTKYYIAPHQQSLQDTWQGQIAVIETLEQALEVIGIYA